jgi:hypothetical protein
VARPLRFRHSPDSWSPERVRADVYEPLDANLGAESRRPWFRSPEGFDARRFEVANGDLALFCWRREGGDAYWLGNTETPPALWRTDKRGFGAVPHPVARWAEREFLATLREAAPWLADYDHVSWFFLPVLCSKDGRETTRAFFRDHAAGFPDATREEGLGFLEATLRPGALDPYRETMAGKLGTSETLDLTRMTAAMGEFVAARLLTDAGYDVTPEIEVTTGHSLDFRAGRDGAEPALVEVTRPLPTGRRSANTAVAAVRDTVETKTSGQLEAHGGGVTLFVDCSSFPDDDWRRVAGERPAVGHRPAVSSGPARTAAWRPTRRGPCRSTSADPSSG